jgi:DNA-binding beta-propeller fold protein YncE
MAAIPQRLGARYSKVSPPQRWQPLLALALLLVATLLLGACNGNPIATPNGGSPSTPSGGGTGNDSECPPLITVSIYERPLVRIQPSWVLELDRPVTAALSQSGDRLIIGRSYGSVRTSTHWGVHVYDVLTGQELWTKSYRTTSYRTIEVEALGPAPLYGVSVFAYNNSGTLYAYDAAGKQLWTRAVISSTLLRTDAAAQRVLGVDRGRELVFVVDAATGREMATVTGETGTSLQVAASGPSLAFSGRTVILITESNRVLARVPARDEFTAIQIMPNGDGFLVATGGSDSAVYRLDNRGQLVWQRKITVGGSNSLAVSPDGRYVMAYNVGIEHGMTLIDGLNGKILRRNSFTPVENAKSQFVRSVTFLADDGGFLVDYAVSRDLSSGHAEERILLYLSADLELKGRLDLGANVDVLLSADGTACIAVDNLPIEITGAGPNKVKTYDLSPLLGL